MGFDQQAELILNFDYTQSARFIVDGMRLLMNGDDKGAEEALRVATRRLEASRDREQAPPMDSYCVTVQTQNRFMPLVGQSVGTGAMTRASMPRVSDAVTASGVSARSSAARAGSTLAAPGAKPGPSTRSASRRKAVR